jgi:endonuclease/exonuclease/phosphatase family metal-dependent hydrolase
LQLILIDAHTQYLVASFNIRYENAADGKNSWIERRDELSNLINQFNPDILGIQEGLFNQVEFLKTQLPEFDYAGVGRDDGKHSGEYSAIFYNFKKWRLVQTSTYWLSESPERISVGWDASMNRIVTYAKLEHLETQKTLHVFNTHFDHLGEMARVNSAKLIIELTRKLVSDSQPCLLLGDLNAEPASVPIKTISSFFEDAAQHSSEKDSELGTYQGFGSVLSEPRIDYIFTRNCTVNNYKTVKEKRVNGLHFSDHYLIMAKLSL